MRTSPRHLSRLHFDFSGCKTSIEFDAQITQLSRLRDDGGQLLACCTPGSGVGNVVFGVLDARCGNGGLPAGVWILAFGGEGLRVLYRVFRSCGFALREQGAGKDAPREPRGRPAATRGVTGVLPSTRCKPAANGSQSGSTRERR
jgi:hypothetical protein